MAVGQKSTNESQVLKCMALAVRNRTYYGFTVLDSAYGDHGLAERKLTQSALFPHHLSRSFKSKSQLVYVSAARISSWILKLPVSVFFWFRQRWMWYDERTLPNFQLQMIIRWNGMKLFISTLFWITYVLFVTYLRGSSWMLCSFVVFLRWLLRISHGRLT